MKRIGIGLAPAVGATLLAVAAHATPSPKVMFVTSDTGTGNLSTWAHAGGKTGVAAADAVCVFLATNAGLANPTTFKAWLSDSNDDAYCRIHGLTGKKAANCGEASLPVAAGPWVRPDGEPFGEAIDLLLDPTNEVIYPPRVTETHVVTSLAGSWTGTYGDGTLYPAFTQCSDWTSSAANQTAEGGQMDGGAGLWTSGNAPTCEQTQHLMCFETGAGPSLPPFERPGVLAFATSASGDGKLSSWAGAGGKSGVDAADAVCESLAASAALPDPPRYKAWLSTSTLAAGSRFQGAGPWVRVDGARVADDFADLTDGSLQSPIEQTEQGEYLVNVAVWSGTFSDGSSGFFQCNDWTDSGSVLSGGTGSSSAAWSGWSVYDAPLCSFTSSRLYCLADVPFAVFKDGFESGNTSKWSKTVP